MNKVGKYKSEYNTLLHLSLPCVDIFESDGLKIHISKRHPNCLQYIPKLSDIINTPDYIGTNPKEKDSIEFIKQYADNVLVAVKLDPKRRLYVCSIML